MSKCYMIVIEEFKKDTGYTTYVDNTIYMDEAFARKEFYDRVDNILQDDCGDFYWVSDVRREQHLKTNWAGNLYVTYSDTTSDEYLNIYLHESFLTGYQLSVAGRIKEAFGEYAVDAEELPMYAQCYVRFNDNTEPESMTFKLASSFEDEHKDDRIFFYCDGLKDLLRLCDENNGEDFVIVGLDEFFSELN